MEEQEYMDVMKMVSVKSRLKVMASLSRLPVRRECERLEGVVALGGGRTRVDIGVVWWPSEDGRFPGLDLKTRGASGAAGWR
jgi:hypothetical protein